MYFAWFWEITPIESSETTDMGKIANVNFGRNTDMGFFPSTSGASILDVFFFWRPEFYCNGHCLKPPRSPGGLRVGESNTVHCSGEKKPTNNFLFQLLSEVFFSGNPFFLDSYELWVFFFFFPETFRFRGKDAQSESSYLWTVFRRSRRCVPQVVQLHRLVRHSGSCTLKSCKICGYWSCSYIKSQNLFLICKSWLFFRSRWGINNNMEHKSP